VFSIIYPGTHDNSKNTLNRRKLFDQLTWTKQGLAVYQILKEKKLTFRR
jgi:hypothetical protein